MVFSGYHTQAFTATAAITHGGGTNEGPPLPEGTWSKREKDIEVEGDGWEEKGFPWNR